MPKGVYARKSRAAHPQHHVILEPPLDRRLEQRLEFLELKIKELEARISMSEAPTADQTYQCVDCGEQETVTPGAPLTHVHGAGRMVNVLNPAFDRLIADFDGFMREANVAAAQIQDAVRNEAAGVPSGLTPEAVALADPAPVESVPVVDRGVTPATPAEVVTAPVDQTGVPAEVSVTPAAAAHAEETGVDLNTIQGTGVDGTIVKPDVVAAAVELEPATSPDPGVPPPA